MVRYKTPGSAPILNNMRHTLLGYARSILDERDVTPMYRAMVIAHCKSFAKWSGRSVRIADVKAADVNAWLESLKGKLSPHTVCTYRRNLLMVWRNAIQDGLNDNPPLRVRRIRKPPSVIEAYTHAELKRLLHAAAQLKGRHRNGNRRSVFWQCLIHAAYSSGLRRGDLLLIYKRQIADDGSCSIIQSKTNNIVRVRFSPETLKLAAQLDDANGMLLPWPYRKDALVPRFRMLCKMAGVNRGSLKWIRRSSASYAESLTPGAGSKLLGHRSPGVFKASYEDQSISGQRPIQPPPLA
jgi:integrase